MAIQSNDSLPRGTGCIREDPVEWNLSEDEIECETKGGKPGKTCFCRAFSYIFVHFRTFSYIFVLSLILSFKFASLRIVSLDLGVMDSLDLDWTSLDYIVYLHFNLFHLSFSLITLKYSILNSYLVNYCWICLIYKAPCLIILFPRPEVSLQGRYLLSTW